MTENTTMNTTPNQGSKNNLLAVVGILAVVGVVAFVIIQASAYRTNLQELENMQQQPAQPTVIEEEVMEEPSEVMEEEQMEPGVVEIDMNAGSYYFDPAEIRVNLGDTVRITFNSLDMMHNFVLDEYDIETEEVSAGDTITIEFVADLAGEFEYYCGVANHRSLGQVGTFIVEELPAEEPAE